MTVAQRGSAPAQARPGLEVASRRSAEETRLYATAAQVAPRRGPQDRLLTCLLVAADLLAALGGLALAKLVSGQPLALAGLVTLPLMVLIMNVGGRYDRDAVVIAHSTLDEAPALMALAATYALAWSLVTIAFGVHSSRGAVLVLWCATACGSVLMRFTARRVARELAVPERILVIGSDADRRNLQRSLEADPMANATIAGFVELERFGPSEHGNGGAYDELADLVAALGIDRIIVSLTRGDPDAMLEAVAGANGVGAKVSIVPSIFEVIGTAAEFDQLSGVTVMSLRRSRLSGSSAKVKRAMDVVCALTGLVILAPLGVLIAIAVRLDSPGPVLFRQLRIGRDGARFHMLKFRSMVVTAEEQRPALEPFSENEGIFKMSRDPRVTRVGRLLRARSLDELPQLVNVLRGEMSLVGPRPLVPEEDCRVQGRHRTRLQYSPGMTGPWQVLGPARPPLSEMLKLDYLYGANWSLWSDLKYILRTVCHVASRRGL
jgi:exopolysaccharide biosynthesis polyprenyl glycosylphosphotransferase